MNSILFLAATDTDLVTVIYGLQHPPPAHPNDKPLLRPVSMLGKGTQLSNVSFLRRTEYISNDASQRIEPSKSRLKADPRKRKRPTEFEKEDPRRMITDILKGFTIAYPRDRSIEHPSTISSEEQRAWDNPRHPDDPSLKLLDAYPLLPDVAALGDTGSYLLTKFSTNPTTNTDTYDTRLDVAFLRPLDLPPEEQERRDAMQKAHETDPSIPPPPPPMYDFEYFLPSDAAVTQAIKAKFDVNNPNKDDEELYDQENKDTGKKYFRYSRVRAYETYRQQGDPSDPYNETVALALYDGESGAKDERGNKRTRLQKGAYFYPIASRTVIKPKRQQVSQGGEEEQQGRVDVIEVVVREPDEEEAAGREHQKMLLENAEGVGEMNGNVNGNGVNGGASPHGELETAVPVASG